MWTRLALLMLISVGCSSLGCVEGEWGESAREDEGFDDEARAEGADSCPIAKPAPALYRIEAQREDVSLCQTLAEREQDCNEDCPATVDVAACANRYSCSRQLWRQDIVAEVYACIAERPCDDRDPAATCLTQATGGRQPSEAQRAFDRELLATEEQCGDLISVTPGQNDAVYDALARCMADNDSCDGKSSCAMITLGALVEEACGATDVI